MTSKTNLCYNTQPINHYYFCVYASKCQKGSFGNDMKESAGKKDSVEDTTVQKKSSPPFYEVFLSKMAAAFVL